MQRIKLFVGLVVGFSGLIVSFAVLPSAYGVFSTSDTALANEIHATSTTNFSSGLNACTAPIQPVQLANPTIITNCTQVGVQSALDKGGHIRFSCGAGSTTIPIDTPLRTNAQDTVIDGGGLVTLDGQNKTKILIKPFSPEDNTLTIQNMRFINGRAPTGGDLADESGAAITSGSPGTRLHIINSTFENNNTTNVTSADNQGGAIFSNNSYETIISGSVFTNNSAGNGGAIGGLATGMIVYNTRFANNSAVDTTQGGIVRGYGGAIHLDGVTNNYNPDSNKVFHVCGCEFEENTAIRGGGAIGSVVSDNKGTKATFERSTFKDNEVAGLNGEYGQGGAIYHIEDDHDGGRNEDNLEISQVTFSGNRAGRQGGAAWLYVLGNGTVVNSTFDDNRTTAPFNTVGQGGAMAITLGKIDIINSTFANNHATYQAGAIHGGGANDPDRVVTLQNTIFYNNTLNEQSEPSPTEWQGYHTNRPFEDGGQNIQYPRLKPTYNNDVNNNVTAAPIYQDPLLGTLGDNGGINATMPLQQGSPAINAGADGCPSVDQRDATRVGQCDIGAFEFGGSPTVISTLSLQKRVHDMGGTLPYTQTVAYKITLANTSAATAENVIISDTLPAEVTFADWATQDSATYADGVVTWGPAEVPGNSTITIEFTVDLDAPAGTTIRNTATYSGGGETGEDTATFRVGEVPERQIFLPLIVQG